MSNPREPVTINLDVRLQDIALAQARSWHVEATLDDLCLAGLYVLLTTCGGSDDLGFILSDAKKFCERLAPEAPLLQ